MASNRFLTVQEQQNILNQVKGAIVSTSIDDKLFVDYGAFFEYALLGIPGFVTWRSAFRAFNLSRYGKGRVSTLLASQLNSFSMILPHDVLVRSQVLEPFRTEDGLYHAKKSAVVHSLGITTVLFTSICVPFIVAQKNILIPVPDDYLKKPSRKIALEFIWTRLKPFGRTITLWTALSFVGSAALGYSEYQQSLDFLAKIGRKSVIYREDS